VKLRTTASGGGLYPVDIYLVALNVKGLDTGVYLYSSVDNVLVQLKADVSLHDKINSCYAAGRDIITVDAAAFVIVFVGKLWKNLRKYGNRGLRYMFVEAGEMAQNIHLVAESLGIGTVDVAGFYDPEVEELIGIDGMNEHILHTIIGGVALE